MSVQSVFSIFALLFIISGCSDDAQINYYDTSLKTQKLKCASIAIELRKLLSQITVNLKLASAIILSEAKNLT